MAKTTTRKDGYLVKSFADERTGKRVYIYAKTERELDKKVFEYLGREKKGRFFEAVADEWWDRKEPKLALQSKRTYRQAKDRAVASFGQIPVKEITPRDISVFLRNFAEEGYSMRTASNQRMVLSSIFSHAIREGDIQYNPVDHIPIPEGLPKKKRNAATPKEEDIIKRSSDVWLFPSIALYTGMRKGEILALQWQDIDFDENYISITKSVSHNGDRPEIKKPKTEAGTRTVPLLAPLKEILLKVQKREPEHYVISDDGKKPLTNRRYITLYDHYRKETGIKSTAHQIRHSFATIAFENHIQPKTVQGLLGHRQLSTTMDIYTDLRRSSIEQARDSLNAAFGGNFVEGVENKDSKPNE